MKINQSLLYERNLMIMMHNKIYYKEILKNILKYIKKYIEEAKNIFFRLVVELFVPGVSNISDYDANDDEKTRNY